MKNFALFFITLFLLSAYRLYAQTGVVKIYEDERIQQITNVKTQMDRSNKIKDGYTIQLYYGERSEAHNVINNYKKHFTDWTSSMEYETPNYKVWVGNFITRLEADRALLKIHKYFPNAFVFKPERKEKN